jgi:hypothetical protein
MSGMNKSPLPPHPKVIATRTALSKRSKPSLPEVLAQAAASHRLRFGSSSNGPKPASA